MKILITAPNLDVRRNVSGISTVVRQIIDYGRAEYVHFVTGRADGETAGIPWVMRQIALPFRFYAVLKREKPDIVHINTAFTGHAMVRDSALILVARAAGIPQILAIHGGRYLMSEFSSRILSLCAGWMLRAVDTVLVLSDIEKQSIERRWADPFIEILPNAVPTRHVQVGDRDKETPNILFLGRCHESKGLGELVEASKELASGALRFNVTAFGDGPERDSFVKTMSEVLGERFKYGGVADDIYKWTAMANADIFVLPSRYGEGLPMAMLEAMLSGCIVIVSDNASISSVVKDGENGFLIASGNAQELAKVIESVLRTREDWPAIRTSAMKTVAERFTIGRYTDQLEGHYAKLLRKKPG
jgi:glycosyltransferase involved in cell wall biosynthesis